MSSLLRSWTRVLFVTVAAVHLANGHRIPSKYQHGKDKIRTVVTSDLEQDDLTSLIRYLLYTPDFETQGLIYTSSRFHWQGDFEGTKFFLPGREYDTPQTSFRWTGNTTIQDIVIPAYAQVHPNLRVHDPAYPTPDELLSLVKIGNVDFEGEYDHDTEGSDHIKSLILDNDPRLLYLQAWGGTSTIARALKSIEDQYSGSSQWHELKDKISDKVVIMASGFQDETYANYIAPSWPELQVRASVVEWTTYNCNVNGSGNVRGLPDDHVYFTGAWIRENVQIGPYGSLYRSWLDGQHMPGDPLDVFGNTTEAPITADAWCQPLDPYDFLGEGDDGVFFPFFDTGIQDPADSNLGGWGGRAVRNTSSEANLWQSVIAERAPNGAEVDCYGTDRFISAAQNDMAARIQWTLTPEYKDGNHPPSVKIVNDKPVKARPGSSVTLTNTVSDPDGDEVTTSWWQYVEEGTFNGTICVIRGENNQAVVEVPADAKEGETISIILQATDDGEFPLTRYDRVVIQIKEEAGWW